MGAVSSTEIIELFKAAQAKSSDEVTKNFTQPGTAVTGLQGYNLEAPSKKLYPVLTPIRNQLPRVGGGFAIQANWKAITGINVNGRRIGVSEGNRGATNNHTLTEQFAAFRGLGLEKNVSFEAVYAGRTFEDARALATQQTLEATMIEEEKILLGGNTTLALGTTPTPVLAAAAGAGTMSAATKSVICVALGLQAYWDVAGANNGAVGQTFDAATAIVPGAITRTNADGSSDTFGGGSARQSAAATVAITGTQVIQASLATPVRGAYGYAWFMGPAGTERLVAISTINSVIIAADPAGGAQLATTLPAADNSTSPLEFDGLLTMIARPALNAYYRAMGNGTPGAGVGLSQAGGNIVEIQDAFADFYNRYRLSPQRIYVNAREMRRITELVTGANNPQIQIVTGAAENPALMAGRRVGFILNSITGEQVELVVHPNIPPGTLMFFSTRVPGYVDNVTTLAQVLTRQEYYQIEWPLRTRRYEYGVYVDEVLQNYFPPAFGMITNIGA